MVPHGRYEALVVSPLASGRLNPPDICLIYATPGQMIILINGLQYTGYKKFEWGVVGETACVRFLGPCACHRRAQPIVAVLRRTARCGGVPDEEMLMALSPAHLQKAITGMKALAKNGLRYPIAPYGIQSDVRSGIRDFRTRRPDATIATPGRLQRSSKSSTSSCGTEPTFA